MTVRRVVTGRLPDGSEGFVEDGSPPNILAPETLPGCSMAYVWASEAPADLPTAGSDPTRIDQEFFPAAGGSRFMVITYPPGFGARDAPVGTHTEYADMAATASVETLLMHTTDTVDYGVVIAGELCLILESGDERVLHAGDVVVQNGVNHGWRNRANVPALVAFVILGAHRATADSDG
jgi:hypothetical protein